MQRRTRIGIGACMAVAALCWAGCGALNKQLLDYATVDAGATIKAIGSSGDRSAASLINGVKDSSKWSEGEGWEYTWRRGGNERAGSNRNQGGVIETAIRKGSPWVIIKFNKPRRINQIVIHEANAPGAPAVGIENAFLQVRDMDDDLRPWKTVGMVKSGWGLIPGRQPFKMKQVSKFLFNTVKTDQVRVVINTMAEKKRAQAENSQNDRRRTEKAIVMTVRLMEIEVKGSEADMSSGESSAEASSGGKEKSAVKESM